MLSAPVLKQPYALVVSNLFIETRDNNKITDKSHVTPFWNYIGTKINGLRLSES